MNIKQIIKDLKEYMKICDIGEPQHNLTLKILTNIAEAQPNAEIIYMDTDSIFIN